MKKFYLLMVAAALLFSLSACSQKDPPIESRGLFLLEPGSDFEYYNSFTWEDGSNLSDEEAFLIHVYDIIPDEAESVDLTTASGDYTLTLNGETTYESLSSDDAGTLLATFYTSCGYADPLAGQSIAAGSEPVRAISVFQINKSDITDDTTAAITIANNDPYSCTLNFTRDDIQSIDLLDRIFDIEESPTDAQAAAAYYPYAVFMYSFLSYADANNLEGYTSAIIMTKKARTYGIPSAIGDLVLFSIPLEELNSLDDGAENCTEYQRIKAAAALPSLNPETVKQVHPEIADDVDALESNLTTWCESFRRYINSYGAEGADETNSARSAALTAAQNIIDFYQNDQ